MRRTIPAWAWMICSSFTMPETIPLFPNAFFLCMVACIVASDDAILQKEEISQSSAIIGR
jgi:hypothetical protein